MSDRPKTTAVYAEMVSITILSLVAASMWIELTKGTICRVYDNNPFVLLIAAISATMLAIFGLKYMFCHELDHRRSDTSNDETGGKYL
jgi:hypothetical protein